MSGTQRKFSIRQLSLQLWMISSHLVGETGKACRELEIQVKLGHQISFLTGTLLHGVKGSSGLIMVVFYQDAVVATIIQISCADAVFSLSHSS